MTDITRLAPRQQQSVEDRRAEIIDELRQMQIEMALMKSTAESNRRTIDRLQDRNDMLEDELDKSKQGERVVTAKLFRLAEAMSNMSDLAKKADDIMKSVKEWNDDKEQQAANAVVTALPARQDGLLVKPETDEFVDTPAEPPGNDTQGAH